MCECQHSIWQACRAGCNVQLAGPYGAWGAHILLGRGLGAAPGTLLENRRVIANKKACGEATPPYPPLCSDSGCWRPASSLQFCWERGARFGHLSSTALLRYHLEQQGHEAIAAARNLQVARIVPGLTHGLWRRLPRRIVTIVGRASSPLASAASSAAVANGPSVAKPRTRRQHPRFPPLPRNALTHQIVRLRSNEPRHACHH